MLRALLVVAFSALVVVAQQAAAPGNTTENVILVTLDGLRWQDVFTGADHRMLNKEDGGVADVRLTRQRFWRGEAVARRELLMPFLWSTMATEGQVFGDPEQGSPAKVTNPHRFSYPGYAELLVGLVNPLVDTNNKFPNPDRTVLEWLHTRPGFDGRIAAFSGWDVHPFILARGRSGLFVESAWEKVTVAASPERLAQLQAGFDHLPRYWEGFAFDAPTFARAKEYLQVKKPRVLYLALGETDEWGHGRRYDLYLQMARTADAMLRELWQLAQADPQYRGKTSLLVTVDHGRGRGPRDWTDHGAKVEGADEVWMAVMGPDTPPLGVRKDTPTTQSMVAATVAALLAQDYRAAVPQVAPPLPGAIRGR